MILAGCIVVIFIGALFFIPVETVSLRSSPRPSSSYEESMKRIREETEADPPGVADYGHAIILTHGRKTEHAAVFYHGYTNCPRQYEKLAKRFFEKGWNVYVPRIPHHGMKDLFTKEIGRLTIQELMDACDSSVDIARGLGEKVTVLGLSMGGIMAAWNAQWRRDVDKAVVIVPSFGWYFLPGIVKPLINLAFLFPNMFIWWDPIKRDNRPAPYSMYYRFSSHGMGHVLRLGLAVLRAAKKSPPGASRIVIMTNDMDIAVDELNIKGLADRWRRFGAPVEWFHFPRSLKMEHDIIDPLHPYSKVDVVYDKIMEYV